MSGSGALDEEVEDDGQGGEVQAGPRPEKRSRHYYLMQPVSPGRSSQPVLHLQIRHPPELRLVVRDERGSDTSGVRCNQQIVGADRSAAPGERVADLAVVCARVRIEGQDVEVAAEGIELACVALDAFRVGDPVESSVYVIEEMTTEAAFASKRSRSASSRSLRRWMHMPVSSMNISGAHRARRAAVGDVPARFRGISHRSMRPSPCRAGVA